MSVKRTDAGNKCLISKLKSSVEVRPYVIECTKGVSMEAMGVSCRQIVVLDKNKDLRLKNLNRWEC